MNVTTLIIFSHAYKEGEKISSYLHSTHLYLPRFTNLYLSTSYMHINTHIIHICSYLHSIHLHLAAFYTPAGIHILHTCSYQLYIYR